VASIQRLTHTIFTEKILHIIRKLKVESNAPRYNDATYVPSKING